MQKSLLRRLTVLTLLLVIGVASVGRATKYCRTQDRLNRLIETNLRKTANHSYRSEDRADHSQLAARGGTPSSLYLAQATNPYPQAPPNAYPQALPNAYPQAPPHAYPQSVRRAATVCVTSAGGCRLPPQTYTVGSSCNCRVSGGGTYFGVAR